jgi:hypothetical protein
MLEFFEFLSQQLQLLLAGSCMHLQDGRLCMLMVCCMVCAADGMLHGVCSTVAAAGHLSWNSAWHQNILDLQSGMHTQLYQHLEVFDQRNVKVSSLFNLFPSFLKTQFSQLSKQNLKS